MEHAILRRPASVGALLVSGFGLLSSDVAAEDETTTEAGILSYVKATADRLLAAPRDQLGFPAASPKPAAPEPPRLERPAPARATGTAAPAPPPAGPQLEQALPMTTREVPLAFVPVPSLPPAVYAPIVPDRASITRRASPGRQRSTPARTPASSRRPGERSPCLRRS